MTVPGYEASNDSGPLEFRLQIVVEVSETKAGAPAGNGTAGVTPQDATRLPQLLESAHALLQELSKGLDVRMASFTSPSGVRLVAQGTATPEDLAGIRAVAAALARK